MCAQAGDEGLGAAQQRATARGDIDRVAAALDAGDVEGARTLVHALQRSATPSAVPAADWMAVLTAIRRPAFLLAVERGRIRAANDAAAELLGYSIDELERMTIREIHPFEMARFREVAERTEAAGVHRTRGLTCRCRDGQFVPAEIWTIRLATPDGPLVLAVAQDLRGALTRPLEDTVTLAEYRQLQDQLATQRYLLDHGPEMVLWVGTDGWVYYANETAAEIIGHPRAVLQGMAIWQIDANAREEDFADVLDWLRREGRTHFETRMLRASGETFPAAVTVQLARPDEREYLVSFSRDITDEVRARDEARKYLAELAQVSRRTSMGEMASAVSHEINQPLTAITTYARACLRLHEREAGDGGRLRDSLARMLDCAERAHEVVGKLRDYVRDQQPRLVVTDIAQLLHDCATLIRPEARRGGVAVELAVDPDLPAVPSDAILIQQVVINIARNALEALAEAQVSAPRVEIRAHASDCGVLVEIADNGPGLPPERAERPFEPFNSTKDDGMGIGLSLCRSIIDSHGGAIRVDTAAGRGTTFGFRLPRQAPADTVLGSAGDSDTAPADSD